MNNRITYIDALKGLAIIFVAWGHVAEKSMGVEGMPFNRMYGSFSYASVYIPIWIICL